MAQTVEEYWLEVHDEFVKWRTARKPQWCGQCHQQNIQPGDRYLDTGEHISYYATAKCCETCAHSPLVKTDDGGSVSAILIDQEREDLDEARDDNHLIYYINRMSNA